MCDRSIIYSAMAPNSIASGRTQESWIATPDVDTPGSYPFNVVNYTLALAALSQVRNALSALDDCEAKDGTTNVFRFLRGALQDLDALKTRLDLS